MLLPHGAVESTGLINFRSRVCSERHRRWGSKAAAAAASPAKATTLLQKEAHHKQQQLLSQP
jgi:hypothetical protein